MRRVSMILGLAVWAWGCGNTDEPMTSAGDGAEESGIVPGTSTGNADTTTAGVTTTEGTTTSGMMTSADVDATAAPAETGTGAGDGESGEGPGGDDGFETDGVGGSDTSEVSVGVDCGGVVYACADGVDNDGDGRIDLDDLECTGPCDDDEGSFATGIPGDNMDCKQDCFFDGNSGQGDDQCDWSLRCDPENPGVNVGCEYRESGSCDNMSASQSDLCIETCLPLTPPGCDCFGCCLVDTPEGERTIFLNSHPDCSLDNLDACQSCTQSSDCMNDCESDNCERCFGDEELPEECDETEQMCDLGTTCNSSEDCTLGHFCLLGCCLPPVG